MMTVEEGGVIIRHEVARTRYSAGHDVEDGSDGGAQTSQHSYQDEEPAVDSLP